mmetsp:Transcript_18988/g.31038  ORF Transcript_18988/g.31038 Transcript_18988/m.31038 type:complete len:346 (+) Transcript_18988:2053-3090(+)
MSLGLMMNPDMDLRSMHMFSGPMQPATQDVQYQQQFPVSPSMTAITPLSPVSPVSSPFSQQHSLTTQPLKTLSPANSLGYSNTAMLMNWVEMEKKKLLAGMAPAQQHQTAVLGKRKHSDIVSECGSEGSQGINSNFTGTEALLRPPLAANRVKGQLYLVKGKRKKWDGKRFARCCSVTTCDKLAQGTTAYCKNHGGGTRCSYENCSKAARGGSQLCAAHGGGRRCTFEGCSKAAIGQHFCRKHGGGRQCSHPGCTTSARGKTEYCVSHGGGTRCCVPDCRKSARTNIQGQTLCRRHATSKFSAIDTSAPFMPGMQDYSIASSENDRYFVNAPVTSSNPLYLSLLH